MKKKKTSDDLPLSVITKMRYLISVSPKINWNFIYSRIINFEPVVGLHIGDKIIDIS